jgi:hypothetical protein
MRRFLLDTAKCSFVVLVIFIGVGVIFYRAEMVNRPALSWVALGLTIAGVALGFGAACAGMLWSYDWLSRVD